jgi:hypothetical protein
MITVNELITLVGKTLFNFSSTWKYLFNFCLHCAPAELLNRIRLSQNVWNIRFN